MFLKVLGAFGTYTFGMPVVKGMPLCNLQIKVCPSVIYKLRCICKSLILGVHVGKLL